jgi:hypothetical protein
MILSLACHRARHAAISLLFGFLRSRVVSRGSHSEMLYRVSGDIKISSRSMPTWVSARLVTASGSDEWTAFLILGIARLFAEQDNLCLASFAEDRLRCVLVKRTRFTRVRGFVARRPN